MGENEKRDEKLTKKFIRKKVDTYMCVKRTERIVSNFKMATESDGITEYLPPQSGPSVCVYIYIFR